MMRRKPNYLIQVPNQRLFNSKSAARYLDVCPDTLRKYADLGRLKARRLEKRRVFALEDLDSFIEGLLEYTPAPYTHLGGKPGGKEIENGN